MRAQQTACQHIANINKTILILDGLGHSGDYERFASVLEQILEDLQDAAEFIDRSSSRNAPQTTSFEYQNNDKRSPHIDPTFAPPDCEFDHDERGEKAT